LQRDGEHEQKRQGQKSGGGDSTVRLALLLPWLLS
jgi:hypothetical protein